jgi:signal transduction histidine kinase
MFKNIFPKDILSRKFYNLISVIFSVPFYVLFLLAMHLRWVFLPEDPFFRLLILGFLPLLLISLYLTSFKRVFPQRLGDCLQSLLAILLIGTGNVLFGERFGISGPFFIIAILIIPIYVLLLDYFLPLFIGGAVSLLLIIEFLLTAGVEISFISILDLLLKISVLLLVAFVSSNFIKRIIAERKISQKLKIAYEELKRLDKAKSEFISIASHQLRTPLTAIKGYISMIFEKIYGEPPEKMAKPLENIYASNERLIKLVNDLLSVSRIEAGRMEMNWEKLSIEEIITSIVEEFKIVAKEKGIYLKFEKPPKESKLPTGQAEKPLPKILLDRDKIRQVIMNVVDNAIRYTEKGGVTIKLKTKNEKLKIEVSDTGEGLTKYELSKIFESFSRGAAGTRLYTEGVGLGLYIAKRFIEMHKGKIWAESRGKGKGSTFYIELPIK